MGAPRQRKAESVTEIVPGIGQEGHGISGQAIDDLDNH
jgi:hypothetical protein